MTTQADMAGWARELDAVVERIDGRFGRAEPRRQVRAYLRGRLAPVKRKNGWQLAEAAGDATPDGVQEFLGRVRWDADAVRDDLRAATICGPTSASTSGTPMACWCWTRPGS